MAKLVIVAKDVSEDTRRGDVSSIRNDDEDLGRGVVESDLFRVVSVPGDKSLYEHLLATRRADDMDVVYEFRTKRVDLAALEALEVSRKGRDLVASDEVAIGLKATLDALVTSKPTRRRDAILPPPEDGEKV